MTAFLRFHDLSKSYYEGSVRRIVLQNAHAEFQSGEITAILGKSGSGKSTLLNLISGIDAPDGGQIWVDGQDLTTLSERDRTLFRRARIGRLGIRPTTAPEWSVSARRVFFGRLRQMGSIFNLIEVIHVAGCPHPAGFSHEGRASRGEGTPRT